jgi:RHS repeat-associated protein
VNYPGKQDQVQEGIVRNLKFLGQDGAILTAGKSGKVPPGQIIGGGGNNGGGPNKDKENFMYFFHPDHLGSSSYITDASGEVYQHLEYFAFGETFVEEHSNTDRTPYLFNGKELDEETGLYYYGARFYDPRTSVWQSVDPLAEKMPGWSPYNYTFNNPVVLTDPDGKFPIAPLLWWAGRRAAAGAIADVAVQVVSEWVSGGGTMGQAWSRLDIDEFQVARSAGENLVKGKYTSAALSAAGDMVAYMMANDDWTWEGALLAAGEGGLSAILGDKLAGAFTKKLKLDAGGGYGKFDNQYDEFGNLLTNKNHLPTMNSYKLAGFRVSNYMGSAQIMTVEDHKAFISTGSSKEAKAFRNAEAKLLKSGRFMDAFDLNANAIRHQFGDKYNRAIEKARDHYQKNVVPILQQQL